MLSTGKSILIADRRANVGVQKSSMKHILVRRRFFANYASECSDLHRLQSDRIHVICRVTTESMTARNVHCGIGRQRQFFAAQNIEGGQMILDRNRNWFRQFRVFVFLIQMLQTHKNGRGLPLSNGQEIGILRHG